MGLITLEVCVDSVRSALAAAQGGADRLELCAALSEGGLTPTLGLYKVVKCLVTIPVFVMIRPRAGFDFNFSTAEKDIMRADCRQFVENNADGFVIGALTAEHQIDIGFIQELVDMIGNRPITFHRAFDVVRDPRRSLQMLMETGKITRVLTSGQRRNVADGLPLLQDLQELAAGRLILMPGSGVNKNNIELILTQVPSITEIHLSGKQRVHFKFEYPNEVCANDGIDVTDSGVIREMRDIVDRFKSNGTI